LQLTLVGAEATTLPSDVVEGRLPDHDALEVIIDRQTQRRGLEVGSVIAVNDGPDLEVVGIAEDAGFGFTTAWARHDVFLDVRARVRPELTGASGASQALGIVFTGTGAVDAIEEIDGVEVATAQQAIDALPAASQQKSTLDAIVYTTFVVAAIVVGLFFALITLEKRSEYAVLKAIGTSNGILVWAIFSQAIVASVVGFVIGFGLSRLAGLLVPADVPTLFLTTTAVTLLVITLSMGALGAIFSFRRVITIDPANALGGAA
jgi:putative ABC transport system permease protein